ncbi:MAG: nucleotidyltransferase family protein [Candidatus Acidiferrales bacterium]
MKVARRNGFSGEGGKKRVNASIPSELAIRGALVYSAASFRMTERAQIVPIILAAGSSKNLGVPKALARFGKNTALLIAIDNCLWLERPIVVLGCDAARVRPAVPRTAIMVVNRRWREGQLSSLLCAMKHVPRSAAVLVYPVDQPLVKKRTVKQLVREFRKRESPEEIVMPRHKRQFGHPIILSAALRNELLRATTAREVVYRVPGRIRTFEARTSAIYEDFDTPKTYLKCLRRFDVCGRA